MSEEDEEREEGDGAISTTMHSKKGRGWRGDRRMCNVASYKQRMRAVSFAGEKAEKACGVCCLVSLSHRCTSPWGCSLSSLHLSPDAAGRAAEKAFCSLVSFTL